MVSIPGAFLLLATALFVPFLFADVYKWTDADGRVHYGDRPGNSNAVTIKTTHLKPATDTGELQRLQDRQYLLDTLDANREKQKKRQAEIKAAESLKQSNCEKARGRLGGMQNSSFLYEKTADPDNPRILSQEEYDTAVNSARHDVDVWCNGKDQN